MVKLVDTPASGAGGLTAVEVRVFFWAPIQIQGYGLGFHRNPRKRVFAFPAIENQHTLPLWSELARGAFKGGALSQTERIIVLVDREQSRSHRNFLRTQFL